MTATEAVPRWTSWTEVTPGYVRILQGEKSKKQGSANKNPPRGPSVAEKLGQSSSAFGAQRSVQIDGVIYPSVKAARKALGWSRLRILNGIANGRDIKTRAVVLEVSHD